MTGQPNAERKHNRGESSGSNTQKSTQTRAKSERMYQTIKPGDTSHIVSYQVLDTRDVEMGAQAQGAHFLEIRCQEESRSQSTLKQTKQNKTFPRRLYYIVVK